MDVTHVTLGAGCWLVSSHLGSCSCRADEKGLVLNLSHPRLSACTSGRA